MIRCWIACLACMIVASVCLANDSAVAGEGGRVRMLLGEQTTIRMVKETVRMEVYPAYYDVTVEFTFQNEGPATTVQMGFPESGVGDIRAGDYHTRTGFRSFRTWVDEQPVTARRLPAKVHDEVGHYQAFWVKDVSFARDQTRQVRVAYRANKGDSSTGEHFARYDFTGGNWKGTVDDSTLELTVHTPGDYLAHVTLPKSPQPVLQRWQGSVLRIRWKNWQAEGSFVLTYFSTYPGWLRVTDMTDWSPAVKDTRLLTLPGQTPTLDWLPPAVLRTDTGYISLKALARYLTDRSRQSGQSRAASVEWNKATRETVLAWNGHIYGFQLKRASMTVDGKAVPLPVAPFLSRPRTGTNGKVQAHYVPLRPLVEALGGVPMVNVGEHEVTLNIPLPKE
ncbi:MAG: hypothetical protein ACYC7E_19500 [Armatimonadota bacterium]